MSFRVVVTRPTDDALTQDIAAYLCDVADVTGAAVTRIVPTITANDLPALRGDYDWVMVTSKNTVAVVESAHRANPNVPSVADLAKRCAICAVGRGTAAALTAHGITPTWVAAGSAAAIIADWDRRPDVRESPTPRVLIPCSAIAKPTLRTGLIDAGCDVTQVSVYTTQPITPVPQVYHTHPDVVVALAGSAVRAVADVIKADPSIRLVTIGRPSADVARQCGITPAAVARTPDARGLADAIIDGAAL